MFKTSAAFHSLSWHEQYRNLYKYILLMEMDIPYFLEKVFPKSNTQAVIMPAIRARKSTNKIHPDFLKSN